jgi:dihydropteroate synthase
MKIYQISKPNSIRKYLTNLEVDSGGVEIISQKMELLYIEIKELKTPAVNILKQDALSVGAELAVPSGVILCEKELYDCLLIGTKRALAKLAKKELAQPFGLKSVAKALSEILQPKKSYKTKIMGVLNANSDSFYSGSRFVGDSAIEKIDKLIEEGADIIDIGGVSSRPGSSAVSEDEELARVKDILDTIKKNLLYKKVDFSIDSYSPKVVEYALKCNFRYINDITGARDDRLIKLAIKYKAKYIIMHMQGEPKSMQDNPKYDSVVSEVAHFFQTQIQKCQDMGLNKDDIILDVGIGFGKTLEHNIQLLQSHEYFTKFGCEVLIGASRKSMIDKIYPSTPQERLSGSLAIHLKALDRGASIIRCHDVKEHKQAVAIWQEI